MRLRILHTTNYTYAAPARSVIQLLRLTPRNHEGQLVRRWRIDLDRDGRLIRREDSYGNLVHSVTVDGPLDALAVTVTGEIETQDTAGMVRGAVERFPPSFYLRDTALTRPDPAIRAFAEGAREEAGSDPLAVAHALMAALRSRVAYELGSTKVSTTAAQAFSAGRGVCQDLTHIFVAAARCLGLPGRYVSGYLLQREGPAEQDAAHAWGEVHLGALGWVGFDPANAICPTDAYIRVAAAPDYAECAPIRGARYGGVDERLEVHVRVDQAGQMQQ